MTSFIVLAIIVVIALAVVALIGGARRKDGLSATGALSTETLKRDRAARKAARAESGADAPTGKDLERSVTAGRNAPAVAPVATSAPVAWTAPDVEAFGVTRRQFINRSIVGLFALGISAFGVAIIGYLWPTGSSGFGSKIKMGKVTDLLADIRANNGFLYKPEARAWVTAYPAAALPKAETVYSPPELTGMEAGLVALYQKCPHLGCRVPSCASSQWFECPCHGSQFNQVG
ncbi:MAG: Rieske 2Fe-2S domain-containing protein, partial [Microthrixaceae bacterium]|nr:Rieske 2Fe-2S domain-containing protein [Microthrixaceae bacterium]